MTPRKLLSNGLSEHFFLLSEDNQLKVLDGILGERAASIKAELSSLIKEKREIKSKIAELGGEGAERERQCDLLNYQINEIERAELKIGEFDELKALFYIAELMRTFKQAFFIAGGAAFPADCNLTAAKQLLAGKLIYLLIICFLKASKILKDGSRVCEYAAETNSLSRLFSL